MNYWWLTSTTTEIDPISHGVLIGCTVAFFILAIIFAISYFWSIRNQVSDQLLSQVNWFKKFLLKNRSFFFIALAAIFLLSAISLLVILLN